MGRVILDSDDEDAEVQLEDEHGLAEGHTSPVSMHTTRQGDSSDERNRKAMELIYAEIVQPTPMGSRKRTRDDAALTPKTSTKKTKLRRISSTGMPAVEAEDSSRNDLKADILPSPRQYQAALHHTQGGDTEMASSTMPRFRFEGDFTSHNPHELFPEQSMTGPDSSGAIVRRELEQTPNGTSGRTTRDSTQGTSTLTFPSLEDHSVSQEAQKLSETAQDEKLSLQLSGKVAENYQDEYGPNRSAPVVDIPNLAQTPKQPLEDRAPHLADSPDELSRGDESAATHQKLQPPRFQEEPACCKDLRNETVEIGADLEPHSQVHYDELLEPDNVGIKATSTTDQATTNDVPDLTVNQTDEVRPTVECADIVHEQSTKRRRGRPRIAKEAYDEDGHDCETADEKEEVPTNNDTSEDRRAQLDNPKQPVKKKTRGRPKKSQGPSAVEPSCLARDASLQLSEANEAQPITEDRSILQEKDVNTQDISGQMTMAQMGTLRTTPERDNTRDGGAVSGEIEATKVPQSTPTKAPTSPTKAPSHSPLNKGRVPFKVGLSKRARIEPLLRVVRKEV